MIRRRALFHVLKVTRVSATSNPGSNAVQFWMAQIAERT